MNKEKRDACKHVAIFSCLLLSACVCVDVFMHDLCVCGQRCNLSKKRTLLCWTEIYHISCLCLFSSLQRTKNKKQFFDVHWGRRKEMGGQTAVFPAFSLFDLMIGNPGNRTTLSIFSLSLSLSLSFSLSRALTRSYIYIYIYIVLA